MKKNSCFKAPTWTELALALCSFSCQAQSLKDWLEVYWNFDERKGNVANDSSGNKHTVSASQVAEFYRIVTLPEVR